jgi:AraC-like DNA-binding protein
MNTFFKYLTPSQEDIKWGINLHVAGFTKVQPGDEYPSRAHPSGYYFRWQNGRILHDYALVYISEGQGIHESSSGSSMVHPGTIILAHPGVWHRYKPHENTGWSELYIGFDGTVARMLMSHPAIQKASVINFGYDENMLDCFYRIFDLVKEEKPGFQLIASGTVVTLIGRLIANIKYSRFEGTPAQSVVEQTKFLIRQNLEKKMDFEEFARTQNISYSNFRKLFKKYTGFSPHQFQLNLRILKAKELLIMTDMSVKQVAIETGFESDSYFSRCFRAKTGQLPSEFGKT